MKVDIVQLTEVGDIENDLVAEAAAPRFVEYAVMFRYEGAEQVSPIGLIADVEVGRILEDTKKGWVLRDCGRNPRKRR